MAKLETGPMEMSDTKDLQTLQLHYEILRVVYRNGPVGASSIVHEIGNSVGEATIGRILRLFDRNELTEKVSNKGRQCTEHGQEVLRQWGRELFQHRELGAFLKSLDHDDVEGLIEVLEARMLLEARIAKDAALNATDEQIEQLRNIIIDQIDCIEQGGDGAEQDLEFHYLLAESSGNRVLRHALNLVRHQSQLSQYVARIRKEVGSALADEHSTICERIAARDPEGAEEAMKIHVFNLIRDVTEYFAQDDDKADCS